MTNRKTRSLSYHTHFQPDAKKLDEQDLVSFKELLIVNSKMVDTLAQLLIQKGVFTEEEFYAKLKEADRQYQAGKRTGL